MIKEEWRIQSRDTVASIASAALFTCTIDPATFRDLTRIIRWTRSDGKVYNRRLNNKNGGKIGLKFQLNHPA